MRRSRNWLACGLMTLAILQGWSSPVSGQTLAERLEAGIYQEETIGNLDEAMKIYREVMDEAKRSATVAAQAQLRLGQCLWKQGKQAEAKPLLRELVEKYADQKDLVAKVHELIPPVPALAPAPWKSGEHHTLALRLASGDPIGVIGLSVAEVNVGDRKVWDMRVRRYVFGGQNQGVSHIEVATDSNFPTKTSFTHTLLGDSSAVYHDGKLELTSSGVGGPKSTKTVELQGEAFSNDQVFFAVRQLPLAVGYESEIPICVEFGGGNQLRLGVKVPQKEDVETPLGKFSCFRVDLSIGQTFWIADDPQHTFVAFEAEGLRGELAAKRTEPLATIDAEAIGGTLQIPLHWHAFVHTGKDSQQSSTVYVVPHFLGAGVIKTFAKSDLDAKAQESQQAWAEDREKELAAALKDFQKRPLHGKSRQIAGHDGIILDISGTLAKRSWIGQDTLSFIDDDRALLFATFTLADEYEAQQKSWDALRESFRLTR